MTKRERRTYTDEFKAQVVKLYESGKPKSEIIKEYQVDTAIAGNMINNFSHVQDVYVWVIFTEDKVNDNIRGSMRSRQVIINDIAEEFGGGGHHYACGVKLQTKSQMESLIKKLDQRLKNRKR